MTKTISFFLVDDDRDDIMLFEDCVNSCSIPLRFFSAQDGKEALQWLEQAGEDLPDVIFLDLNMPRMDGKECLRHLKLSAVFASIPVIIYSTSSHSRDVEETRALGSAGFITKPVDLQELERIIQVIAENYTPPKIEEALNYLSKNTKTFISC